MNNSPSVLQPLLVVRVKALSSLRECVEIGEPSDEGRRHQDIIVGANIVRLVKTRLLYHRIVRQKNIVTQGRIERVWRYAFRHGLDGHKQLRGFWIE